MTFFRFTGELRRVIFLTLALNSRTFSRLIRV